MAKEARRYPIKVSWIREEGIMPQVAKLMLVKHPGSKWVDLGEGLDNDDDVMFTSTELVQLDILRSTGLIVDMEDATV